MKIHHFNGIYQEGWGFSWAMLVYQRVRKTTYQQEHTKTEKALVRVSWLVNVPPPGHVPPQK